MVFTGWSDRLTGVYARTRESQEEEWSDPVRISRPEARFDSLPSALVSEDQVLHVVWQSRNDSALFQVLYSRRDPGSGAWSSPVWIEGAGGDRRNRVSLAENSKGNLFVWTHNRPPGYRHPVLQLFVSGDKGQSWQRKEAFPSLTAGVVSFSYPQLAIADDDDLYLLALRTQGKTTVVLASSQDRGESWSAPLVLSERPSVGISDPRLVTSGSLVQAMWVERPEGRHRTRRLHATFLPTRAEGRTIERLLIGEITDVRTLSYSVWEDGDRVGVTWMERHRRGPSAVRQRVTIEEGQVRLGDTSTVAESRQGFHFEEIATSSRPDLVLVTEKKIVTPPTLQACSRREKRNWRCEKLHTTSGSSDILAPMLIAEGPENLYRVIFHEVRFKTHIMQAVLDTTIRTGTLTVKRGGGEASDGGGNQGYASSSQF